MKILMYGDSITDMGRDRNLTANAFGYGVGYPQYLAGELLFKNPEKYSIINRGISGNRIIDLYARIKADVWNLQPDVLSILIGINDLWHDIDHNNGVEIERFERLYRMLIEDTLAKLPQIKIMLCEPFFLIGSATAEKIPKFLKLKEYSDAVKRIAKEYNLAFVPLQGAFNEYAKKHDAKYCLYDGIHPAAAGAKLIANEWLKVFYSEIDK